MLSRWHSVALSRYPWAMEIKPMYTLQEVAVMLGKSCGAVRSMAKRGLSTNNAACSTWEAVCSAVGPQRLDARFVGKPSAERSA